MATKLLLKNYAKKIYQGVEGYSFDKVIKLFPYYYFQIRYYYDRLKTEELFLSYFKFQTYVLSPARITITKIMLDEKAAQKRSLELNKRNEEIANIKDVKKRNLAYLDHWTDRIEFCEKSMKMDEQIIRILSNLSTDLSKSQFGDKTIKKEIIEFAQAGIEFCKTRIKYNTEWIEEYNKGFDI